MNTNTNFTKPINLAAKETAMLHMQPVYDKYQIDEESMVVWHNFFDLDLEYIKNFDGSSGGGNKKVWYANGIVTKKGSSGEIRGEVAGRIVLAKYGIIDPTIDFNYEAGIIREHVVWAPETDLTGGVLIKTMEYTNKCCEMAHRIIKDLNLDGFMAEGEVFKGLGLTRDMKIVAYDVIGAAKDW